VSEEKPTLDYDSKPARPRRHCVLACVVVMATISSAIVAFYAELFFFYNRHATFWDFLRWLFS
jgi:hypothetical protein